MPARYDQIMEEVGYVFFRNIYWKKPAGSARGTITIRNPFPRYYVPKVQTEIIQLYATDEEPITANQMITYKFSEGEKRREEQIPKILLSKYSGNVWDMMAETQVSEDHRAPFPTQLPFNCIRFFTFEKEKVIDPFLGSGSTLIAADQLNRVGYGIEIDPSYVSVCIERFLMYKPNAKLEINHGDK
jgi:site-specific DNA-methyltransferase (adenine-specific)